jgi:hypothetical protein
LPANVQLNEDFLRFNLQLQVSVELFSEDTRVDLILRKKVRTYGFTVFVILLPAAETERILQALEAEEYEDKGIEVLASTRSAECFLQPGPGDRRATGPVFLLPNTCKDADSPSDLLLCQLLQAANDEPDTGFAVMNMVQGVPTPIGTIQAGEVQLNAAITYHQKAPEVYQTIAYSFNNGVKATGDSGENRRFLFYGVDLAMESIKQDGQLLSYHSLRQVDLSLGYSAFDPNWVQQQLANYTRAGLGVATITSGYSFVAMGVYSVLETMNIEIPQIAASNTALALSSRSQYPLFTRVVMSDAYLSVLYAHMIKHFGWTNIGVIYANRAWETDLYRLLLQATQSFNITIRNEESLRALPENPSDEQLFAIMSALVACKVRIIVLIISEMDLYRAIAALYDLGLRRGDVVFLAIEWLSPELFQQSDAEMNRKIIEL